MENFENCKRKTYQAIGDFLSRNLIGQKRMR
jgi:hypothetical protein